MSSIVKNYTIVETEDQLKKAFEHITKYDYLAYDTETTGLNVRKDKVIGISFCGNPGEAFYIPHLIWDPDKMILQEAFSKDILCDLVTKLSQKNLLTWNASFDVRVTKNYFGIDLLNSIFADGMIMHHLLDEEGEAALKKCAIKFQVELGLNVEEEANAEQIALKGNVAANGGSTTKTNYEMYKADLAVLGKYAAADADLTFRLCELLNTKLEQEQLDEFYYSLEAHPLYKKVTIPMEDRGVRINMELLESLKKDIQVDMETIKCNILKELNSYKQVQQWKLDKALELYPQSTKGKFVKKLIEKYSLPLTKTKAGGYSLTVESISKLPESLYKQFLLNNVKLSDSEATELSLELYNEHEGEINISSKKQMGEIVFNYMKIKPLSHTDKGSPQFDDDIVKELAKKYEWAKQLRDYNKLSKIDGTYLQTFLQNTEDGIFYPYFKQHGTISGRFSSNIQQIPRPKEEGDASPVVIKYLNALRSLIIARPGYKLIICDQSSLEPRVFASVSGDENLINVFKNNEDLYSRVAIQAFNVIDASANKKDENYLKNKYPELRQSAKAIALAIPYGAGAFQISAVLGIDKTEAQNLIDGYLRGFPALADWMEDSKQQAQHFGYVSTLTGRIRHLPKVKELYKRFGDGLLDWRKLKTIEAKFGKEQAKFWRMDYKNGINNSRNFQIQGLSASIMNRAGIVIADRIRDLDGHILLQIHDEYVIEVKEENVQKAVDIIRDCMENTTTIATGLVAEPNIADSFGEGHA